MGRSYTFTIGDDAIGESFYTHARAFTNGRAKESPYTEWHAGKCHTLTYKANFPPNDRHYAASPKGITASLTGRPIRCSAPFKLIDVIQTRKWLGEVEAGMMRRLRSSPYHYEVINNLLAVLWPLELRGWPAKYP